MEIERREIPDRESWLKWRRLTVGSSEVASVFNLSPWKSALELHLDKEGLAPEPRETPLMRRGRWMEPSNLLAVGELYPSSMITKGNVWLCDHEIGLSGTPDAFLDDRVVIECKCVARPTFDKWGGEIPLYYALQCLTLGMLADADKVLLSCLILDTYDAQIEVFHVERNPAAEQRIRTGVLDFWQNLEAGIRPKADYNRDGALLAKLYAPKDELAAIDLSADNRLPEILAERQGLRDHIAAYEARCDAIRAEVVEKLNGAPAAICGDWKITHKVIHQPEQIRKATSFPRLTVTRKREAAA